MKRRRIWAALIVLILSAICGAGSSITLDGRGLSENEGFAHDDKGGLIIIAYYPEFRSLGIANYENAPAIYIQNWYGMDTENFSGMELSVLTNESGILKYYNSSWNTQIDSGRAAGFIMDELKLSRHEVVQISISYPSQTGTKQITDIWKLPQGCLDNSLLDYLHLLKRVPGSDTAGNHVYDIDNEGEIIRFSVL